MKSKIEIWKDIDGYHGVYMVSNFGNVKSLDRKVNQILSNGKIRIQSYKGIIMKPIVSKFGYLMIMLNNGKSKNCSVHRLVAKAFIPNPENKKEVNHKNGVKTDNRVQNLEWCTHSENIHHAHKTGLFINQKNGLHKKSIAVSQFTIDGKWVRDWPSMSTIYKEIGFDVSAISNCVNSQTKTLCGKKRTSYGFIWKKTDTNNA
jgi:hypothetical protein